MLALFFTILITYTVVSLFGYIMHWSLHQSWTGSANQSHMAHHLKLYPPADFSSEVYRHAGKDSTPRLFVIASLPLILTPIILGILGILPIYLVITVLVVEALLGFFNDYFHDNFHIKNHFLTRVPGFKVIFDKWVKLHRLHHVDMGTNYGIFAFHWDRVFGTFWKSE